MPYLTSGIAEGSKRIKKSTRGFAVVYDKSIPKLKGNHQKLEQVVINLIQNSCQALSNRNESIRIRAVYEERESLVCIVVEDEARGIPEEHLKRLTDPFFTTKRDQGGTGLGLSVSSGIAEEHGGTLRFVSEPGKGTTAIVQLPVERE